ncbi:MAG: antitoxin [Verrucomicrobia bacterium]|nr:antitoxin [Verrucomicrobiota bacterium]MDA1065119.1 antitoxin [Verrucomicrobiota bacterium]
MSRISIDVTEEELTRIKAFAALRGISLEEYLLKSALIAQDEEEEKAVAELERCFRDRIRRAENTGVSTQTVGEIFDRVCEEKGIPPRNNG